MKRLIKDVEDLSVDDLKRYAVWHFLSDDELGETAVSPIEKTPVDTLSGRVVGTEVCLANGEKVWAILGNIDEADAHQTKHFLCLTVLVGGERHSLARYHDVDFHRRGPRALAEFLRLPLDEVFPISYDLQTVCIDQRAALIGKIEADPAEKLSRAEIIALAVRGTMQ